MNAFSSAFARAAAGFVAALAILFAGYLAAAGLDGLGGGFAAGLALSLSLVLYALIFGIDAARAVCPIWLLRFLLGAGLIAFIALGCAGVARGYNFLDFQALLNAPGPQTQRFGVALTQYCVLASTASAIVLCFHAFAGRAGDMQDGEW